VAEVLDLPGVLSQGLDSAGWKERRGVEDVMDDGTITTISILQRRRDWRFVHPVEIW
jgi:hypothetical protein